MKIDLRTEDAVWRNRFPLNNINACWFLLLVQCAQTVLKNTVTWQPSRGTCQHRTSTTPLKVIYEEHGHIYAFPRSTKYVYESLACTQDFSKICCRSGNSFCCATATTKTVLGPIQLWFKYFRGILACTLPGKLSRDALVAGSFHPCHYFCVWGRMTINLLIFWHPSKTPCHLTHTSQSNHPTFQVPLIYYQTFRN